MCVATTSIAKMEDREWRMAVTEHRTLNSEP
jgi:hypothetical protein